MQGASTEARITFAQSGVSALTCTRIDAERDLFVQIYRTEGGASITIPWSKISKDDLTVNSMKGAVVAFNLRSCPPRWRVYREAIGVFIRGFNPDDTSPGSRLLGSPQDDQYKKHSHSRPSDMYDTGNATVGLFPPLPNKNFGYGMGNPRTSEEGGDETRPKNVALLFCEKE